MNKENLFGIHNFKDYLVDLKMAESRQYAFTKGIQELCKGLWEMDNRNMGIVKEVGLRNIIIAYCKLTGSRVLDIGGE